MLKKIFILFTALVFSAVLITSCSGGSSSDGTSTASSDDSDNSKALANWDNNPEIVSVLSTMKTNSSDVVELLVNNPNNLDISFDNLSLEDWSGKGEGIFATLENDIIKLYAEAENIDSVIYSGDSIVFTISDGNKEYKPKHFVDIEDGTKERPYKISQEEQLKLINEFDFNLAKSYKLTDDIALAQLAWTPIGSKDKPFKGNFDGDNHTISNLYFPMAKEYQGFFGSTYNATLNNLNLVAALGADINFGNKSGVLAGYINKANILNVKVKAGKINGKDDLGGLVGASEYAKIKGVIVNIDEIVSDSNDSTVGGLIGDAYSVAIARAYVNVKTVSGGEKVGGIAGNAHFSDVLDSFFKGEQIIATREAGGIYGSIFDATVASSFVQADKISGKLTGGVAGAGAFALLTNYGIENCYVFAKEIDAEVRAGGLIGEFGPYDNVTFKINDNYIVVDTISTTGQAAGLIAHISSKINTKDEKYAKSFANNVIIVNKITSTYEAFPGKGVGRVFASLDKGFVYAKIENYAKSDIQLFKQGNLIAATEKVKDGKDGEDFQNVVTIFSELNWNEKEWNFNGNGAYPYPILRYIPADLQPKNLW